MINLQSFEIKTLDDYGSFRDLHASDHQTLSTTCLSLLKSNVRNQLRVTFRGINKEYLDERFSRSNDATEESQILSRLFYFGDKSKHFLQQSQNMASQKWLKFIEDISRESNACIFNRIGKLRESKNESILNFIDSHADFFAYFFNSQNKEIFASEVQNLGQVARDYYLSILHTAGRFAMAEDSMLLSTSKQYTEAARFAGTTSNSPYVLIAIARTQAVAGATDSLKTRLHEYSLPTLPLNAKIFPEQAEISLRAGLLPHNLLGIIKPKHQQIVISPHLFSPLNKGTNLATTPLAIDQSLFECKLRQETNFARWYYTYDELQYFNGSATAN